MASRKVSNIASSAGSRETSKQVVKKQDLFSDDEIKQAFDTFDLDRNRFVGAAELSHILNIMGEEVTDQEIDEMINMCDGDGDGQVTFDEFYKLMTQPPPLPTAPPASTASAAWDPKVKQKLAAMNMANSPQRVMITQAERGATVETVVRKLAGSSGKIKPSQIKKVYRRFQEIDSDGSGHIDFREFLNALDMPDTQHSRGVFQVFDADGSNSISLKEFIVCLSRYTTASQSEKVKFAFMMFDEDGSGKIERNELLRMLQASFLVEDFSEGELEQRVDLVYEKVGKDTREPISYEDFIMLSNAHAGLIFPKAEHSLG
jgi:serine/threonine-protein phosphatase 2B regulatory subunit